MESGFAESRLFLNDYLKKIDKWGQNEIEDRAKFLIKRAMKIWKYPITEYAPNLVEIENVYSLSDDMDLTGQKIYQFDFMGDKHKTDSWKDFAQKLLIILYDLEPKLMIELAENESFKNISHDEKTLRRAEKLVDNIFIETNLNTMSVLNLIKGIFKKYNLDENDVSIYIRSKDKEIEDGKSEDAEALIMSK